ncbi:Isotrichodermin C-15 hydroxylase [Elsinoe australis]|uniref:Isotrichodermin C-15 hydroxylase n=1 Tax=Elsinoe australis TaxID=40998 RepID=A0A2P7Z0Q8_9PEZI|nr:Isotrichodermin C-15 hydroxylase [Elsinoe australis]
MLGSAVLFALCGSAITYTIVSHVYAWGLDLKGLRKYPAFRTGAGLKNLVWIQEALRGFRSKTILEQHKKHPVLRIGPNSLSFSDPRAIKDIYGHGTPCLKDEFYTLTGGTHPHLADVVDKPHHAEKRKVLSSAYAIKNLETWEHKVAAMTRKLIVALDEACLSSEHASAAPEDLLDFRKWYHLFAIAAIANIGLSEDIGFLDRGSDLILSESLDGSKKEVSFRDCHWANLWLSPYLVWSYDWYHHLLAAAKILSPMYRRYGKLLNDWNGIVYNRATNRLKSYQRGEKGDDFFTSLMENKDGVPNNLEWGEIVAEISIMMNAGSDTTAIALTNLTLLLVQNPDCLQRLRAEIDEALDEDEVIAPYDKIKQLPYPRACIDEALRIWPPNSFSLPRRTPPEGAHIAGQWIPGNTSVSMSAYVVHHQEALFKDHDTFRPERWLGEEGKELQRYFVAFSTGARGCIGRNISYLEQMVAISSLIKRYEFALLSPGWQPWRRETTTLQVGPMPLRFWRRKGSL